jgi:transaldolase
MNSSLILLDRDGVLNRMVVDPEHGTVDSPLDASQVEILPGVPESLKRLTDAGYGLAVVSNQPAWAKGKVTREALENVHERVIREATALGARILSSHICYHRAEEGCACRKPAAGLLHEAFSMNEGFVPKDSWMVGDGVTDVQAGKLAGLLTALLGPQKCSTCRLVEESGAWPSYWGYDLPDFTTHLLGDAGSAAGPSLRVKVFADGASLDSIRCRAADPMIQGFTTNPTLMRKAGVENYEEFSRSVLAAVADHPVSFEVIADTAEEIERQALQISTWAHNAYVKIPVTTTRGEPLTEVIRRLSHRGVKINVTAVFTLEQVQEVTQALRGGAPSVVSVFAGRIADAGIDPVPHMRAALALCRAADPRIELLWASPREVLNIIQADQVGVDIITVTDDLLAKIPQLGKDLRAFSLETVCMFKRDADAGGYTL